MSEGRTADRDDRLLAPTKWVSAAVIPILVAAFVILYLFPDRTEKLWGWTIRLSMSALIMGGGYLAGAYFFTRVVRSREWHRVGAAFVAITVFSSILMVTTVLHWERFNHDHVSFWAWLLLYASTPLLLPLLWANNRRTDPRTLSTGDVRIPGPVRTAVGMGGALQLGFATFMFAWPDVVSRSWPWPIDEATCRSISAFVAFPAVTWLWFLLDDRWSSFRITQQTATLGLVLVGVGALRARADFRSDGRYWTYLSTVALTIALNVALYIAMERRAQPTPRSATGGSPAGARTDSVNRQISPFT